MYRLLDYSHTKRYLKIENTFSTRKYPIYYSYDPENLETYLTKIVSSKDPLVINYFKTHISQDILPYLHMKRQHKNASILSLPPEHAEVIIKIDQERKIANCKSIHEKIEELSTLLRYYNKYYKNGEFRNQVKIILQFLQKFEVKDNVLSDKIKQITDQFQVFPRLLDQIDQIVVANAQIKQELKTFKSNESQLKEDEKIMNFIAFIQDLTKKGGKIKEQSLKANKMTQFKTHLSSCSQILSFRKMILKDFDYCQKQQYSDKIECIYWQFRHQQDLLQQQQKAIYESNVLYITKKHITGLTLRQMIINKDQRLTTEFCFDLAKSLVDLVFMYGGIKDLFITTQNIIVEECGTFHLNYFSFVGLELIKLKKYVSKADFLQILPYVTSDYLYGSIDGEIKMGLQVLLRFIIVNFLSAFLKKDIIFDAKSVDFEFEVQVDNVRDQMKLVEDKLLSKVLSGDEKQRIHKQFDLLYHVNYSELAEAVFGKSKYKLNWQFVFSRLSKAEKGSSKLYNKSAQNHTQKVSILEIATNSQKALEIGTDGFYVIGISLMEVFDHFTNILEVLGEGIDRLKAISKQKISRMRSRLVNQRLYYEKRGWYAKQIYIPVKCAMTYTQILDYSNWVEMLYLQSRVNMQTIKGVQNLLSLLLQLEEALILVEPLLDNNILEQALANEKCLYYIEFYRKGNIKTYYTLLHNYKDKKQKKLKRKQHKRKDMDINMGSDEEYDQGIKNGLMSSDEESSEEEGYDFKKNFWHSAFATLKVTYELIRNYYLRINEVNINSAITINRGKYSKWIQQFNPTTPTMSCSQ